MSSGLKQTVPKGLNKCQVNPLLSVLSTAGPGGSPVLVKHELINPAAAGLVSVKGVKLHRYLVLLTCPDNLSC